MNYKLSSKCILVLLAFAISCFANEQQLYKQAQDLFKAANEKASSSDNVIANSAVKEYKAAFDVYQKIQDEYPRFANRALIWDKMAYCANKLGNTYEAFELYQKIWDEHKNFPNLAVITRNQKAIGENYLQYHRYDIACKIFETIYNNAPHSENAPEVLFLMAYANEQAKKYDDAKSNLQKIIDNYAASMYVDDAMFKLGYIMYLQASEAGYDQTMCDEAIMVLRRFISAFPASEQIENARKFISDLRNRKAYSTFRNAEYYENIQRGTSAIKYYEQVIKEFPDSRYAAAAQQKIARLKGQKVVGNFEPLEPPSVVATPQNEPTKAAEPQKVERQRSSLNDFFESSNKNDESEITSQIESTTAQETVSEQTIDSIDSMEIEELTPQPQAANSAIGNRTLNEKDLAERKRIMDKWENTQSGKEKFRKEMKKYYQEELKQDINDKNKLKSLYVIKDTEADEPFTLPTTQSETKASQVSQTPLVKEPSKEKSLEEKISLAEQNISVDTKSNLQQTQSKPVVKTSNVKPSEPDKFTDYRSDLDDKIRQAEEALAPKTSSAKSESIDVIELVDETSVASTTAPQIVKQETKISEPVVATLPKIETSEDPENISEELKEMLDTIENELETQTEITTKSSDLQVESTGIVENLEIASISEEIDFKAANAVDPTNLSKEFNDAGERNTRETQLEKYQREMQKDDNTKQMLSSVTLTNKELAQSQAQSGREIRKISSSVSLNTANFDKEKLGEGNPEILEAALKREFTEAYNYIMTGERLYNQKKHSDARQSLINALDKLNAIRKQSPTWEPEVIQYRIDYCYDLLHQIKE